MSVIDTTLDTHPSPKTTRPRHAPLWFTIGGVLGLIWNVVGTFAFAAQVSMSDAALAALPPAQQELYASTPSWATAAFAIAVFGGVAGCIALLLRRSVAIPLFVLSLVAIVVQTGHTLLMSDAIAVLGVSAMALPATVFVIGGVLLALGIKARRNGWNR